MKSIKLFAILFLLIIFISFPVQNAGGQDYVLIGWNDLGMHCSNKNFSKIAVLPPYNNIYAQLIMKMPGQLPQVVTTGYEISYSIPYNTYSVGKTDFWTYAQQLFGLANPLPDNIGLTGKGLTGTLDINGNYFRAEGIPLTPYPDTSLTHEEPFQLIHLEARETGGSTILATTDAVIPVSNEMGCVQSGCHSSEQDILNQHENVAGFNINGPNLCASCHADNALGTTGTSEAGIFSYRMHRQHAELNLPNTIETCYMCHPGPTTQCLRGVMRTGISNPLICQDCHGSLSQVAQSISAGREPWLEEPRCGDAACHGSNFAEEPGLLFRQSQGHGALFCSACHGSPHAIFPTREANDNLQNIRLQGYAGILRDCMVCHTSVPSSPGPHGVMFTNITASNNALPGDFRLAQNYPNPFNPVTNISFEISQTAFVTMTIYDVLGKRVETIVNQKMKPGRYEVKWNAGESTSGLYFYRLMVVPENPSIAVFEMMKKMVLMK